MSENFEMCKAIAIEVSKYAEGRMYRCPDCGEIIEDSEEGCACGCDVDDLEQLSLMDYFDDALDIEYRIDGSRRYRSVRIMVTCGGPNIYIDTAEHAVRLYWYTERAEAWIDADTCDAIDELFEELYNC